MFPEQFSLDLNLTPLVYVAIALGTVWCWLKRSQLPDNIPPFPVKPYPVLGHLPMLMKPGPVEKLHEWRASTGDIFSIYMGTNLVVVMNSLSILKEALVKQGDVFSDRDKSFISQNMKHGTLGILANSGPSWKEQRTVCMAILRRFGVGKNALAEKISQEVEVYLEALYKLKGQPTDVHYLTSASISNVVCSIIIGQRFEFDDPIFMRLINVLNEIIRLIGGTSILNYFPWLQYIPGDVANGKKLLEHGNEVTSLANELIKESRRKAPEDRVDNFINSYYDEMEKKTKSGESTYLDEDNLEIVLSNLFIAGSETTSTTLMWAMLFAIQYPELQEKVYQEIIDVIGTDRLPSIQDRPNMKYTNAFINETQRMASIAPFSLLHMCTETTQVAGYTIPEGTTIIPNLDEVLKDTKAWGDPQVFRPERFLDKDNNLVVPEEFIPYCIGRRHCMGEPLAKMELYLFVTRVFQRFQIHPEHPERLPEADPILGITKCPKPFKLRLVEREEQDL